MSEKLSRVTKHRKQYCGVSKTPKMESFHHEQMVYKYLRARIT